MELSVSRFVVIRVIPVLVALGSAALLGLSYPLARIVAAGLVIAIALTVLLTLLAANRNRFRLGLGPALLPLVAAAVPFTIGTGTQSPIVAGLLFAVLILGLWILQALGGHGFSFVKSPINAPTAALMLVWILSYLYSNVELPALVKTWSSFGMVQLGQLGIVLISAASLLMALNGGRNHQWIRLGTWGLIALGSLGVASFYSHTERVFSFLNTGGLFTCWVVALSAGQALFNDGLPKWMRLGLLGLALAWLFKAMILQNIWFSGWVPSLVALAVITFFRSKRVFGIMLVIGVIAVILNYDVVSSALWDAKVDQGDMTRVPIWQQQMELVLQHPLLGTGPAGYAAYYLTYYVGSAYSMSTHSGYLDILAQTGFVGMAVFLWFAIAVVVAGWNARRRWRTGFVGGYAQGAFGGLLGVFAAMYLGDWFIPFVYNQTIAGFRYSILSWVFIGFLVSLAAPEPVPIAERTPATGSAAMPVYRPQ